MNAAIFIDRDDTLIHNSGDLGDPKDVRLIQGVASAVASLRGLNYKIVVISNQGGVARGKFTTADVNKCNERVNDLIKSMTGATIDRFYYCPFHPNGSVEKYTKEHPWRKPQPGMILQAAKDLDIDLEKSWMIGDSIRDVAAGAAAGTRTIFLTGENPPPDGSLEDAKGANEVDGDVEPDYVAKSLVEAVRIVAQKRSTLDHGQLDTTNHVHQDQPKPSDTKLSEKQADTSKQKVEKLLTHTEPESTDQPPALPEDNSKPAEHDVKPFRPWNVGSDTKPATTIHHKPKSDKPSVAASEKPTKAPPPETQPHESEQELNDKTGKTPEDSKIPVEVTMRQILQELRNRRSLGDDFSFLKMFAVVLQMLAIACLLGALTLGGDDTASFVRYLGTGLFVQLATIAMLLFQKK